MPRIDLSHRRPPPFTPEQYREAAKRCFEYRQQNFLTQRQLAAQLGTRSIAISNVECTLDDPRPPFWLVSKILELPLKTVEEMAEIYKKRWELDKSP